MRILADTNVIIDALTSREPWNKSAEEIFLMAARTAKGTTVIYTAHGFHFYQGAPLINWLVYYPVERVCGKFTDKLITINQEDYHRANSWRLRNNGKIYYVPGIGVDLEEIQNISINKVQKKKEIGISNDVKVLLSVGELNKNKNHEIIIRVLSKLTNKNFIYLICGNGELKEYLKNLAKELGVSDKVKFLGYRKEESGNGTSEASRPMPCILW